jgi:hypothetical protein
MEVCISRISFPFEGGKRAIVRLNVAERFSEVRHPGKLQRTQAEEVRARYGNEHSSLTLVLPSPLRSGNSCKP